MGKIPRRASRFQQPDNDNLSKFVFGSFDGLTCVLGVIAGCYISGNIHTLVFSVIGLALAEGVAMAGGSYLSEVVAVYRLRHAAIIGVASAIGILVPALPFFFAPQRVAVLLSLFLTCALAVIIAQVRVRTLGALEAYTQTFAIVLFAAGISIMATLLLNRVGV
jgi:hypothetical protein